MKKHLSVFLLSARYALWPALIAGALGAAAAYFALSRAAAASGFSSELFDSAGIVVNAGAVVLGVLLMIPLRERGGVQPGYTLRRLRVSELAAFLWQALAGAMAYFIFLMCVAAGCLFYGLHLQSQGLGEAGDMSVLVAMIVSPTAHALLPLGDWPVYIRMAAVLYTLGAAAAYSGFVSRRGRLAVSPFILLALCWIGQGLEAHVGEYLYELLATVVCGVALLIMIISVRSHQQDEALPLSEPYGDGLGQG